jgi:hypothetical protein
MSITAQEDLADPGWYLYEVYSPQVGGAAGVAEEVDGVWRIVLGLGSALQANCTDESNSGYVPAAVAAVFDIPCA